MCIRINIGDLCIYIFFKLFNIVIRLCSVYTYKMYLLLNWSDLNKHRCGLPRNELVVAFVNVLLGIIVNTHVQTEQQ